ELVELLRELNGYSSWRSIYGPLSERLKDQELILRFLAFLEDEENYQRPLKVFLNDFLSAHRNLEGLSRDDLRKTFHDTCAVARATADEERVSRRLSMAKEAFGKLQ